eukprot:g16287.t1
MNFASRDRCFKCSAPKRYPKGGGFKGKDRYDDGKDGGKGKGKKALPGDCHAATRSFLRVGTAASRAGVTSRGGEMEEAAGGTTHGHEAALDPARRRAVGAGPTRDADAN